MVKPRTEPNLAAFPGGGRTPEVLDFVVELWRDEVAGVDRVLGRALNLTLARAVHQAALQDFPGRRVVLRKGEMIIADSRG
jgi:hypothetical protein